MIVSKKLRFVFVTTPKCATHTMLAALTGPPFHAALAPGGTHNNRVPSRWADYFIWSIVRNPYARAVSLWSFTIKRDGSDGAWNGAGTAMTPIDNLYLFLHWIMNRNGLPKAGQSQSRWLRPVRLDALLRLESLSSDVHKLPFWPGDFALPWEERGNYGDWRSYMTPEIIALVHEWADEDFEIYEYERLIGRREAVTC